MEQKEYKITDISPEEMQNRTFRPADDSVTKLASELISKYHGHLVNAKIEYCFRIKKWEKNGKPVPGKTEKTSVFWQELTGIDFCIIVNEQYWHELRRFQKEAVLDHLLCFCGFDNEEDGGIKYVKAKPEVEEFADVIRRHGCWTQEMQLIGEAFDERAKPNFANKPREEE